MAEDKVKGLIIKLVDYKDADKLASIFTFDYGIITAKFTGVKKDKAKLKAVAQPFTFAEFLLTEKGDNKTIISADVIDSFNNILIDYNRTICGYIVLDMLRSIIPQNKPENDVLLLSINALKNIEENNPFVATIDYILKFMSFEGSDLYLPDLNYVYFDKFNIEFSSSKNNNSQQIDKKVYETLQNINSGIEVEQNETILKQTLRFLHNVIYLKFNEDIKSFEFI